MRAEYLLTEPLFWIIPWVLHAVAYFFVLKKMGLKSWTALIPFAAEHELTTVLFNKTRAFWRPFSIAAVFATAAFAIAAILSPTAFGLAVWSEKIVPIAGAAVAVSISAAVLLQKP